MDPVLTEDKHVTLTDSQNKAAAAALQKSTIARCPLAQRSLFSLADTIGGHSAMPPMSIMIHPFNMGFCHSSFYMVEMYICLTDVSVGGDWGSCTICSMDLIQPCLEWQISLVILANHRQYISDQRIGNIVYCVAKSVTLVFFKDLLALPGVQFTEVWCFLAKLKEAPQWGWQPCLPSTQTPYRSGTLFCGRYCTK